MPGAAIHQLGRNRTQSDKLLGPRNRDSVRNRVFVERVISLIESYEGKVLGVSFLKSVSTPMPASSMYTKGFQILAERYDAFLREVGATGMIIADSRMAHLKKGSGLDYTVAVSHLSYVFGHIEGRELVRIVEAPLFADSKLTVGLQIADIISMLTYTNTYRSKLPYVEGSHDGYLDYRHTEHFYASFRRIVFERKQRHAAHAMFGLRTIDHRGKVG